MTILVPVDLQERSAAIVRFAQGFASASGGRIHLLHVVETETDFVGYEAGPETVRDTLAAEIRERHRKLQEIASGLRDRGLAAQALVTHGAISEKILEEADRLGADLIVMGRSPRSLVREVLLGRVSHQVLAGTKVPVTLVP